MYDIKGWDPSFSNNYDLLEMNNLTNIQNKTKCIYGMLYQYGTEMYNKYCPRLDLKIPYKDGSSFELYNYGNMFTNKFYLDIIRTYCKINENEINVVNQSFNYYYWNTLSKRNTRVEFGWYNLKRLRFETLFKNEKKINSKCVNLKMYDSTLTAYQCYSTIYGSNYDDSTIYDKLLLENKRYDSNKCRFFITIKNAINKNRNNSIVYAIGQYNNDKYMGGGEINDLKGSSNVENYLKDEIINILISDYYVHKIVPISSNYNIRLESELVGYFTDWGNLITNRSSIIKPSSEYWYCAWTEYSLFYYDPIKYTKTSIYKQHFTLKDLNNGDNYLNHHNGFLHPVHNKRYYPHDTVLFTNANSNLILSNSSIETFIGSYYKNAKNHNIMIPIKGDLKMKNTYATWYLCNIDYNNDFFNKIGL